MIITKYSEEQLISWTKPASDTEEAKADNAVSMVSTAIKDYEWTDFGINGRGVIGNVG